MTGADKSLKRRIIAGVAIALLALVGALAGLWYSVHASLNTPENLLLRANEAFESEDYASARKLAERSLDGASDSVPALIVAGKAAAAQDDFEGALGYFTQVPAGRGLESVESFAAAGELAYNLGRASEAEKHLRAALAGDSGHVFSNTLLAHILSLEGRSFEAAPFLFTPVQQQGDAPLDHLMLLAGREPVVDNHRLEKFLANSKDPAPRIAVAREALASNRPEEARRILEEVVSRAPHLIEAQARLGEALLAGPEEKRARRETGDRRPLLLASDRSRSDPRRRHGTTRQGACGAIAA
jgi:tetratricopeptide (TPR) repeat protein